MLPHVVSGPTGHAVSEPMQTAWRAKSEQMPLPRGRADPLWIAAAMGLSQQYVCPPERWATQCRVIDA